MLLIREMKASDWGQVSQIYEEGIATGFATFEKETPDYQHWSQAHLEPCRLVAEENGKITGWAALSPVSSRCVYGGVGEVSVYVSGTNRGEGIGKRLLEQLIIESEKAGFWTIQSGIFPENKGSIRLHEKVGFRFIGKREKIGKIDGVWKDNLLFEKRSDNIGIN